MRQPGDFRYGAGDGQRRNNLLSCAQALFEGGVRVKRLLCLLLALMLIPCASALGEEDDSMLEFKSLLRGRILEILNAWPAKDQYAIMFLIYPNEAHTYRGYSNLTEFQMLYKCESDMGKHANPFSAPADEDEEHWNPAYWDMDLKQPVISYWEPNQYAEALIDWYEAAGVQRIGYEDHTLDYDSEMRYIGKGPNGLPELLSLIADIAAELQTDGVIEKKFGRRIPIILADLETAWYMIEATQAANPNGEADAYLQACKRQAEQAEAMREMYANEIEELMKRRNR